MKRFAGMMAGRLHRAQTGFTLAELLIVVGIVVGLAAVILPNVGRFTGSGDRAADAGEMQSLQTAVDTWMADTNLQAVTANNLATLGTARNAFGAAGILNLTGYMRNLTTASYYCWDTTGGVTQQFATAVACTQ